MPETQTYDYIVIAPRAASSRGVDALKLSRADLVVGKDNRVLKDRYGARRVLTADELAELKRGCSNVEQV